MGVGGCAWTINASPVGSLSVGRFGPGTISRVDEFAIDECQIGILGALSRLILNRPSGSNARGPRRLAALRGVGIGTATATGPGRARPEPAPVAERARRRRSRRRGAVVGAGGGAVTARVAGSGTRRDAGAATEAVRGQMPATLEDAFSIQWTMVHQETAEIVGMDWKTIDHEYARDFAQRMEAITQGCGGHGKTGVTVLPQNVMP